MNEHEQILTIIQGKNGMPLALEPGRTALIVVDMQRVFTRPTLPFVSLFEKLSPGSTAGYVDRVERVVIPAVRRLLARFRAIDAPVLFTAVGSESGDGHELPPWLRAFDDLGLTMLGTRVWPTVGDPAWEIDEALAPRGGEPVLNKHSSGGFATTELEDQLRRRGVQDVVVAGISSDVCVSTTAREAADRGFRTIIATDACTTLSERMHEASMETFSIALGWLRTSADIVAMLAPAQESERGPVLREARII